MAAQLQIPRSLFTIVHMNYPMRILFLFITITILFTVSCSAESSKPGKPTEAENEMESEPQTIFPHPEIGISLGRLKKEIADEPHFVQESILARPQYFLELARQFLDLPSWAGILVDKDHPLPEEYAPNDLVLLSNYSLSLNRADLRLSRVCMPAVLAMTEASRIDNVELVYSSAFRSYSYQQGLYERYVNTRGQKEADRFSARPGTSQHQLGTTIDFGSITPEFENTPAGQWLRENAWKYGFSLSYPEGKEELTGYMFEIWHYRYITPTGTRLEREFFGGLQQHMLEFFNRHRGFLEN